MAAYTIEDIELIRQKSGISYQEAVSLLDYHNGNVARALVDLERNGRIQPEAQRHAATGSNPQKAATPGKPGTKGGVTEFIGKLYRSRVKISKDSVPVVNLSALFGIAVAIFAPHVVIGGAIASLVLGYKFAFTANDPDFRGENLERMVRSAADNVRTSVGDFARGFQAGSDSAQSAQSHAQPTAPTQGQSYYAAPRTAATYRASVPTINVPVQVESQDGSVTVEGDAEGYTSATIE